MDLESEFDFRRSDAEYGRRQAEGFLCRGSAAGTLQCKLNFFLSFIYQCSSNFQWKISIDQFAKHIRCEMQIIPNASFRTLSIRRELEKQLQAKICQQDQFRVLECICTICLKNIWAFSSRLIYCMSLSGLPSLQLLTVGTVGTIHGIAQVTRHTVFRALRTASLPPRIVDYDLPLRAAFTIGLSKLSLEADSSSWL